MVLMEVTLDTQDMVPMVLLLLMVLDSQVMVPMVLMVDTQDMVLTHMVLMVLMVLDMSQDQLMSKKMLKTKQKNEQAEYD